MKRTPPKLSNFKRVAPPTELFLPKQRATKLDGLVGKLTAIDTVRYRGDGYAGRGVRV